MMIIIYPDSIGVSTLTPALESAMPIELLAKKDVPAGIPYRIVPNEFFANQAHLPREEWTANFDQPDGFGDDRYGEGTEWEIIDIAFIDNEYAYLLRKIRLLENDPIETKQVVA